MDNFENSMVERRRSPRVEYRLPLQYKNLRAAAGNVFGSLTRDIGEGGVRFKSKEFISLACRLVVEVTLPTVGKPIKAISKVAWIRKIPASDEYELGNQFLDMTKEDRKCVVEFINKALAESL